MSGNCDAMLGYRCAFNGVPECFDGMSNDDYAVSAA